MSNNPNDIKSQDELNPCNDGERSTEVLIHTIEKLEQTQKKLDIAVMHLELIKLEYGEEYNLAGKLSRQALKQIKELDNESK